ncbi:hypothetical protein AK812_SmicGene14597 [Symbiodinium microadriaticum]|uniref:Uncharacterized protein n=1 Tax=Symbiodinium microadriaticum TaxID=2951 RepID=A0A1Q9E564_SYMMI|nr:hypothetical protein AK812_SmicGene14597 [Symbiodinium microadriaticum]
MDVIMLAMEALFSERDWAMDALFAEHSIYVGKITNSHEWKEIFLDYCHHKRTSYSPNPLDKVARSIMSLLRIAPK